jgi:YebC/PmpR family DNA-binding regulatory protein
VLAARAANMSKDTVERAIKRGAGGGEGEAYEEVRYEGYGPGGVAVLVECLTDNRNRTASDVRAAFAKAGGNLGETNSVNFLFDRVGQVTYPASIASVDAMFEAAVDAGADDVENSEDEHLVLCASDALNDVRDALDKRVGSAVAAKVVWKPKTLVPVDGVTAEALFKLLEALEDSDDVQNVFANFDVPDDVMARLSA